jgi:hypothetical protein
MQSNMQNKSAKEKINAIIASLNKNKNWYALTRVFSEELVNTANKIIILLRDNIENLDNDGPFSLNILSLLIKENHIELARKIYDLLKLSYTETITSENFRNALKNYEPIKSKKHPNPKPVETIADTNDSTVPRSKAVKINSSYLNLDDNEFHNLYKDLLTYRTKKLQNYNSGIWNSTQYDMAKKVIKKLEAFSESIKNKNTDIGKEEKELINFFAEELAKNHKRHKERWYGIWHKLPFVSSHFNQFVLQKFPERLKPQLIKAYEDKIKASATNIKPPPKPLPPQRIRKPDKYDEDSHKKPSYENL